jgi:signal transduction histidine kinase
VGDGADMLVRSPVEVLAESGEGAGVRTGASAVTPGDLAELMTSFNEVTQRLEATHAVLRGEVSRLTQELTEANARLRRSERLAELGQMAAGIAHEIRNPLGSISLYSEMLEDDLQGLDAAESAETARKIGTSVRRLDAIVRDVLDFARDLVVRPEAIETSDLIEAAVESPRFDDQFTEPADGANDGSPRVTVRVEAGAESVYCDRSLGLQALLNVVENARQANAGCASGSDSGIEVFARPCRVRTGPDDSVEGVAIGVRDHGPGIDPGVLERMFNPFFTTRETGTGLGLAIVHRIVDAHGGGVVVRNNSELGGGSGATVELQFPSTPVAMGAGDASRIV